MQKIHFEKYNAEYKENKGHVRQEGRTRVYVCVCMKNEKTSHGKNCGT